jgi:hypothetical protein
VFLREGALFFTIFSIIIENSEKNIIFVSAKKESEEIKKQAWII